MSGKHGPPKGEPWIWVTRAVLQSAGWRDLGINARRLIDFLLLEHMSKGGKQNGYLLAPREQLEAFGIGHRHITAAIEEAKEAGLVNVKRGVGRRPSTYALTWLPVAVHEGDLQSAVAGSEGDRQGGPKVTYKARSSARRDPTTGQIKGVRRDPPYKNSYHGRSYSTVVSGDGPGRSHPPELVRDTPDHAMTDGQEHDGEAAS